MSDSLRPHGLQPTRLLRPWDFPGKSTGVGCHQLFRDKGYYTLKVNCKEKSTLGKANKGINVEKNWKLKLTWGEKKEENSTELQKPNGVAEVYGNNKKCDWGKKKLKSLIGFLSANKIDNCNREEKTWKGKRKKIQCNLQNKWKNKNNKCFSWVRAITVLSHAGSHSLPHLPRMPSNTVLVSGPAVEAAQILTWSYSCVFLPPMSTAIRTSAFSFVGPLNDLLYIP